MSDLPVKTAQVLTKCFYWKKKLGSSKLSKEAGESGMQGPRPLPQEHLAAREVYRKNSLRLRSGASGANSARSRTAAPGRLSKALVTHSHVVSHTWSIVSHFRFSRLFFFFFLS